MCIMICKYLYLLKQPEDKKKSVREQLLKGITDAERRGKILKEEQKQVKENVSAASKQVSSIGKQ